MPININDKIKELSPEQRRKVEARAAQLIAEESARRAITKSQTRQRHGDMDSPERLR